MDYKNYSFNSLCLTVYRCCSEQLCLWNLPFHINGLVLEMLTGPGASEIFVFSVWAYMKAIGLALSFVLLSIGLAFIAKFYF